MKKIIAFILSMAIFLSVACISLAQSDNVYIDEVKILRDIGVLDDDFVPEKRITRGEFVGIIAGKVMKKLYEKDYPYSPFIDVTSDTDGYKAICAAFEYGLVSESEDGMFHPEKTISLVEAEKILVSALGYDKHAMANGGYPTGYLKMASELGIIKKLKVNNSDELLGYEAVRLILNSLEINVCGNKNGLTGMTLGKTDESFMWKEMGISKAEGVLSRNSYTSLLSLDDARKNEVQIGDFVGNIYHTTDEEEYLGYFVECYYRTDDYDNVTVLSIIPKKNKNNVTVVNADEFVGFSDGVLSYQKAGASSIKKEHVNPGTAIIYNGNAKIDYDNEIFDIKEGTIVIIDNNKDGDADVIRIDEYEDFVVEGIDRAAQKIAGKYGNILDCRDEENERSIFLKDADGNPVNFEDVREKTVISAIVSESGNYIRGIVSEEYINSKWLEKKVDDDGCFVTSGTKVYEVSLSFPNDEFDKVRIGADGETYINAFGKIAAFYESSRTYDYAMLIKHYVDTDDDRIGIKMITASNSIKNIKLAENAKINGIKVKNYDTFEAQLSKNQMFIFTLNAVGEIKSIETEDGNTLHYCGEALTYSVGAHSYNRMLPVTEKTPVFFYPDLSESEGSDEEYYVLARNVIKNGTSKAKGYNTNSKSFIPDVVTVMTGEYLELTKLSYSSPMVFFSGIHEGLNYEEEVTYYMDVYKFDGTKIKLELQSKEVYERLVANRGELESGDIITYNQFNYGVVDAVDKILDYEEKTTSDIATKFSGSVSYFKYTYEINQDLNIIGFSGAKKVAESIGEVDFYHYTDTTPVNFIRIGSKDLESRKGTVDELTDLINDGIPQKVFINRSEYSIRQILVFEED